VTCRANGEGTVTKRADGRWMARLSYLDPITGQRQRATFYAKTAKDVRAKLKDALDRPDAATPPKDATPTVADWLKHWRATVLAASGRKQLTRELYATLCRVHLEPEPFGAITLDRLRPSDITALILALRAKTKPGPRTDDDTARLDVHHPPRLHRASQRARRGRDRRAAGPQSGGCGEASRHRTARGGTSGPRASFGAASGR
jgi:hypothetical protein